MHSTVKKTLQKIRANRQHYLVTVKGNQKTLHELFKQIAKTTAKAEYKSKDKQKGRIEHRHTQLYDCPTQVTDNWLDAKRMIVMRRYGTRNGKRYDYTHYYLTSIESDDVPYFANGIRKHWSIENNLHWVKDVRMNEDNSHIANINASKVLSLLKSLALNIYRLNGYMNWKPSTEIFINRLDKLKLLLRT